MLRFATRPRDASPVFPQQGIETKTAPARYQGGDTRVRRRLEQAHIAIGFEGKSYAHEDFYAMQIFASAVGGGMSSRLFQEVRETRGLAYSIHAFPLGLFGYRGVRLLCRDERPRCRANCCPSRSTVWARRRLNLSDAEVRRAKAQMKVSLLAALELPAARCEQIARQLIAFDRVLTRDEIIAAIDRLDVAQIRAAGARALRSAPTVAAIGPVAKALTPERVASRLRGI